MVTTPIGTSRTGVRWWQFSLGTLLLVALLACVGAAYFGAQTQFLRATKQNLELQEANSQLMKDRGILSVADESKILLDIEERVVTRRSYAGNGGCMSRREDNRGLYVKQVLSRSLASITRRAISPKFRSGDIQGNTTSSSLFSAT